MAFTPKTWANGPQGETPITASELNRIEAGIEDVHDAVDSLPAGPTQSAFDALVSRVEDLEEAAE